MTDYLPPPPAEIVIEDIAPGQLEYEAQGGMNHKFWAKIGNTYQQVNAYQFEMNLRNLQNKSGMIDEFEESLKEALAQDEISSDVAQTFADIFGISLKREYEFCVTVEFTFTAELGQDDDPDSLADNLQFSVEAGYYTNAEIDNTDYSVQDTSYTEV